MSKRPTDKLLAKSSTFDDWWAVYSLKHDISETRDYSFDTLQKVARDAYIRGYMKGTHNTIEILKNEITQ